jgi:cytochrome P450
MTLAADINPFLPEVHAHPYPVYRAMRESDPVHWSPDLGVWFLSRYEDVMALLRDQRFSADRSRSSLYVAPPRAVYRSLLTLDPPDHTRLRGLVSKAFTPRVVEALRPRIEMIVDRLLDAAAARGEMEAITEFAYPLPVTVIAEMLGVPAEDWERFREWSATLAASLDPVMPEERWARVFPARDALFDYFRIIVAERRSRPRDDLISAMVAAEENGDVLSEHELLVMCNLLLVAGHETTVNLLGNGLLALLTHPETMAELRARPALTESAVEELLRFDSPVQFTGRVAVEEAEIGGRTIAPRQSVVAMLGAANRDPDQFPSPDRLDLARSPNLHLAFGRGIHFCLGAPLARLEGQIALTAMLQRFPRMRLGDAGARLRDTVVLRGLSSLPLVLG